jgi:predicted alpha/beta-hydrolase family hydrolase
MVWQRMPQPSAAMREASVEAQPIAIDVGTAGAVSGLLMRPSQARACYVLAHGAGAGMNHSFMAAVAGGLFERGIATLRYQFPYMEKGSKRPDPPGIAHATVRAAVTEAHRHCPTLELVAGGKSFGGRMTSQAQAKTPLEGVRGLAFLGFPLHPAKKPAEERGEHLADVRVPMLFLQGTKDALAELPLIERLTGALGPMATLKLFEHADHSFHVPVKSGRTDAEILHELLDDLAAWIVALP